MLGLNKLFAIAVVCVIFAGCTPDKLSDVALPIPGENESLDGVAITTNTLKNKDINSGVSPASAEFQMPDINTPVTSVCQDFIHHLNAGDSNVFELLLTPAALNVSNKLKFSLPPLGEENADVKISEPKFSTIRERICFVDCVVSDTEETEISLMLRKGKQGWRVAGMMVEGSTQESKNLLSFESVADVVQIRDSLNVSVSTEEQN